MHRQSIWERRREVWGVQVGGTTKNRVTRRKKDGADLQDRLNETVDTVLNGKKNKANKKNTAVKIKKADGSVVIDEEREAKKAKAMANTLDGTVNIYSRMKISIMICN